jgi:hypothetical protein
MSNMKNIGIYVAVAAATGAIASSSASAELPEWQKGGEALKLALPFTISGGTGSFENAAGTRKVTWTSVAGKGLIEGTNKITKLSLVFWGSKGKEGAEKECEVRSPKAKEGEIVTQELKGVIGYLNKAEKKVGVAFEAIPGKVFAELESKCFKSKVLTGGVIGKITSAVNKEVGAILVSFNIVSKAQEFAKFEGGKEQALVFGGLPEEAALFSCKEETLNLEGNSVEVKA